jgi:hypothetical protein
VIVRVPGQVSVTVPPSGAVLHTTCGATQVPFKHAAVEPEHVFPQPPQLFGSELLFASQPFETTPSQSAKPPVQAAIPQEVLAQKFVAFGTVGQAVQLPQWAGS